LDNGTRILFVGSSLGVGGAERQWSILIPALGEHGFDPCVLTLVDEGPFFHELLSRGIRMTCARMRHRTDLPGLRRAFRLVEFQPALVVTQSINAHVIGHLIARRVHSPHITTEHGGPGAPSQVHRNALHRLVGPRVDHAIAVSGVQIPRLLDFGYKPERIRVVPNGVPEPIPTQTSSVVRPRFGVRGNDFLAVLVATLRPEKSVEVFIRAVQKAHRGDPRVRALVVGGGPELEHVRRLAGEDGVVRVLGERLDVPEILNAADVACLSSSAEGVPMALLEAMALGKPVVATDVGGIPEAVEHENTGLLVPAGDVESFATALLRLAADRALAERFARAAKERHRARFGVDKMIGDYVMAFHDVLRSTKCKHLGHPAPRKD
jgi:glycosyltransferase involved in cell wall biosynthesis